MTDKSKSDAPQAEELTAEELDAVNGGYIKMGDIKAERRLSGDDMDAVTKRERDKNGYLIITMENTT